MTPGQPDPRPTGFGAMSWAWWPVLWAGWTLAAVVMGAEWVASGAAESRERPGSGHPGAAGRSRTFRARSAVLGPLVAVLALSALAACSPAHRPVTGDPPMSARADEPDAFRGRFPLGDSPKSAPTATVPNPFFCPGPAPSPAPPAPRGEP